MNVGFCKRIAYAVGKCFFWKGNQIKMDQFILWGTVVNVLTVVCGSVIGLLIKRFLTGNRRSKTVEALSDCIFKGLGLCVLGIGITGTIKAAVNDQILEALGSAEQIASGESVALTAPLAGERPLIIIFSVVIGVILGHFLRLDDGLNRLGDRVEALAKNRFGNVAQGFVSASLLFCVGSMTIVGSLNSGLLGDHTMLYTKAMLDLVSSIILSMTLGIGILFSAGFVFTFQGGITLLAQWIAPFLTAEVITCMTGVGSILIIGLALNVLGITKIKVMNYVPAILMPAFLIPLADWIVGLL